MKVQKPIEVIYHSSNNTNEVMEWLQSMPDLIACDFEAALKYSNEALEEAKRKMEDESTPKIERIRAQAIAKSSALGHPSHCTITHFSFACSEREGYVAVLDNPELTQAVLDFLVTTEKTQVWHKYSYDGRLIRYYTGKDVLYIQDSQILAKTLLNHVEVFKANSGLKELAGQWYGDWGITSDNFTLAQQHDPQVIKYAATDACATYKLWCYLVDFVNENRNE